MAYAREDAIIAAELVETLRAHGVRVMWDRNLRGGERFRKRIGELIERAGAVLVIWSTASVASDFVIDEAEAGKAAGKLVTCRTAELRDADIPFGFRGLHCADVADIDGILDSLAVLEVGPRAA
ncbi:MAG: toll/interleukin-1 receptor domain-containing protein [Hyphomicrobiaceae bacterium]